MPDNRKRIADIAFLLALMVYILAGTSLTPIHGDEFMHMAMARDTFTLAQGEWSQLAYAPPVQPDSLQNLRLINGTINKTLIGVIWMITGRTADSLPGIYAWAMPMDWNQRQGNVPTLDDLHVARWPSTLLTALGVIPVFLLGWQLRLRSLAYPAALLYALHPVILLNGRRAMLEGSLMLATLLTMSWLVALIVAEHSAVTHGLMRRLPPMVRYGGLGVLAGLAIAAKHTGLVVAVAALTAALVAGLTRDRSWRPLAWTTFAGIVAIVVWLALNPAYWNDPLGATWYTINARSSLLAEQSTNGSLTYTSVWQRVQAIVTEPFLTPPQYYESDTWAGLINDQIAAYESSSINGWDWGSLIGVVLTTLAGIGLLTLIYDALHRDLIAWAILIWTGATVLSSLAIPLDWQRYYLPLLLPAIILAAAGLGRLVVRRVPDEKRLPTVVESPAA
ncbi:MAG: hypothetical protein ABI947_14610 [Chloroflexota bacterium]